MLKYVNKTTSKVLIYLGGNLNFLNLKLHL